MRLSEFFELSEFENSATAKARGISNKIPAELLPSLVRLHDNVLYPLRKFVGHPVRITSGYRCAALNKAVGGAANSQHSTGEAADIEVAGQSNSAVFNWIRKNCEFDQLILESVNGVQWVHVSFRFGGNRRQCLAFDGKRYVSI